MKTRMLAIMMFALMGFAVFGESGAQTIEKVFGGGPEGNRIKMVFFSEGYTAQNLNSGLFKKDVDSLVVGLFNSGPNWMKYNLEPYPSYKEFFIGYTVLVESREEGYDTYSYQTSSWTLKDTYFNANAWGPGKPMSLDPDGYQKMFVLQKMVPNYSTEHDASVIVINSNEGGGSSSGGDIGRMGLVIGARHSYPWPYPNPPNWDGLAHEIAHGIKKKPYIGDEYEGGFTNIDDTPYVNITAETQREKIPWNYWIEAGTPIPTPELDSATTPYDVWDAWEKGLVDVVGLFRGALYHSNKDRYYRPQFRCIMNSVGDRFCKVCREALILSFYERVRPIDSVAPVETVLYVPLPGSPEMTFSVAVPRKQVVSSWSIDGVDVQEAQGKFSCVLRAGLLEGGDYELKVAVKDTTSWVRRDPLGLLSDSRKWMLQTRYPCDFDGDGRVWFRDFMLFASVFGTVPGMPKWHPMYDLDKNGRVDFPDFTTFVKNWGKEYPVPAAKRGN